MKKVIFTVFLTFLASSQSPAAGQSIEYKIAGQTYEGYLATPDTKRAKNPAVLIVHDWMGPSEFTKAKADQMASMGYVAFAVDMYGKGHRPKDSKEAGAMSGKLKGDLKTLRERINAGFDALKKQPGVDKEKVVAFGYCFGGTTVLELARSGAPVMGTASFHGGIAPVKPEDAKNIKGKVLVMHGALDPYVPPADVQSFVKEMNEAKVPFQLNMYSGAVHAFAVPSAGNDLKSGAAYNADADHHSWEDFQRFLKETAPL